MTLCEDTKILIDLYTIVISRITWYVLNKRNGQVIIRCPPLPSLEVDVGRAQQIMLA